MRRLRHLGRLTRDLVAMSEARQRHGLGHLAPLLPPAKPGTPDGPWTDERLQKSLALAKTSVGDTRDRALVSAAFATWKFGQGDLAQAQALLEQIENRERRSFSAGELR